MELNLEWTEKARQWTQGDHMNLKYAVELGPDDTGAGFLGEDTLVDWYQFAADAEAARPPKELEWTQYPFHMTSV